MLNQHTQASGSELPPWPAHDDTIQLGTDAADEYAAYTRRLSRDLSSHVCPGHYGCACEYPCRHRASAAFYIDALDV